MFLEMLLLITLVLSYIGAIYFIKKRHSILIDLDMDRVKNLKKVIYLLSESGGTLLYVPGTGEITDPQSMVSISFLKKIIKLSKEYGIEVSAVSGSPFMFKVLDEAVVGADYISMEPFALAAYVSGKIKRERLECVIYMGLFGAESFLMSESASLDRTFQLAGTANNDQLPFFMTSTNITVMGEDMFNLPAALSNNIYEKAAILASDIVKILIISFIIISGVVITIANVATS